MQHHNKESVRALNQLIETCKDGEKGFRCAADHARTPDLKALFRHYAEQRKHFAGELQSEVGKLGGTAENCGSVSATLHRGWINIKSLLTGTDEVAMIAECEHGEDAARKDYEEALKKPLSEETRALLQRQALQIKEAHARILGMEMASHT
jgi:uncharacterized protein (TIGR02284 family)